MAYDFGANTLGIKNPFKTEGLVKSIAGAAICILGIISLVGRISESQARYGICLGGCGTWIDAFDLGFTPYGRWSIPIV